MTLQANDWLPAGVAERQDLRAALAEAVGQWAEAWFAAARPTLASVRSACGTDVPDEHGICWSVAKGPVAAGVSRPGRMALAALALGPEIERLVLTETERDIVEVFVAELLGDLSVRVGRALGCGHDATSNGGIGSDPFTLGGLLAEIDLGPAGPLRLAVPMSAIVAFCRTRVPAPDRRPRISAVAEAVGASPITVTAILGTADLALGDFMSLAAGDVLVLNRTIDEGADLFVEAATTRFARGALEPGEGQALLTLHSDRRDDEYAN
ncbi:FliM/FliN family flagellar motor switch protein [Allosphingosinicella sp.]|uniref:FliM/FliN family flagellar motor switch protein n=1 Tax=Allosphingosinicella sp. TaxID=2823234 RepID=UPI002EE5595F